MIYESNQLEHLRKTLQYCYDNEVEVLTLDEALSYFDSPIDLKTFDSNYNLLNETIVDSEGNLFVTDTLFTKIIPAETITNETPPSDFPSGTVSIADFNRSGTSKGLPYNSAVLATQKTSVWEDNVRQFLFEKWANGISYRSAKVDGGWNEWQSLTGNVKTGEIIAYKPVSEDMVVQ